MKPTFYTTDVAENKILRVACVVLTFGSLVTSFVLLVLYREMGGPGDQLVYYKQAAKLIPFVNTAYGPVYFVVIRGIHDLFGLDWFLVGKITSWVSAMVFLTLCYYLFKRLLGPDTALIALALVAINPTFIGGSYSASTIMFGACPILAAILITTKMSVERPLDWSVAGLLFGIAYLTRFQALALLIGAVAGMFLIPNTSASAKIKAALVLTISAAFAPLVWNCFLLWQQGYIPKNSNSAHLAIGLGEFVNWADTSNLTKYGSLWAVLTSNWDAPLRIGMFALKEGIKFPFTVGYGLLFIAAGWIVPGAAVMLFRRDQHGPWLVAFAVGLLLTGIGSLGWLHYYTVFLPFAMILVGNSIQSYRASGMSGFASLSWIIVLGSTLIWSPYMVRWGFLNTYWPEFAAAREYVEAHKDPQTVVSTTAASFRYGTKIPFVDMDDIVKPKDSKELVSHLRQHRVSYLIITERHTLYDFPELKYLLNDNVENVPPGLQRELLIKDPRRLAIYRVLAP